MTKPSVYCTGTTGTYHIASGPDWCCLQLYNVLLLNNFLLAASKGLMVWVVKVALEPSVVGLNNMLSVLLSFYTVSLCSCLPVILSLKHIFVILPPSLILSSYRCQLHSVSSTVTYISLDFLLMKYKFLSVQPWWLSLLILTAQFFC